MNPKLAIGKEGSRFWVDADSGLPLPDYRPDSELTPAGEQLLIPGCEKRPQPTGKPVQRTLWD